MFIDEKAAGEKQPVKVGTLKLSEAIRIGAKLRPQGFGYPFSDGKSCAIGAAYEGRTGKTCASFHWVELSRVVPEAFQCSWDGSNVRYGPVGKPIVEKNDDEKLTREQIADWLESQGY